MRVSIGVFPGGDWFLTSFYHGFLTHTDGGLKMDSHVYHILYNICAGVYLTSICDTLGST